MKPLLQRIAINGGLAALVGGIIGFMIAELASIWLAGSPGVRTATGEPVAGTDTDGSVATTLRTRMPLTMAVWGFVLVAVGELVLDWWRGRRRRVTKPAEPAQPDAEKLLEELLKQAEAASRQEATGDSGQETGDRGQETQGQSQPASSLPAETK
jgi:hypothetical protein